MSSILKALKRLEEEKAERLDAPVDIARDILRQPRRRSHSMPWLALAIAGCGVVVAVGLLVLWYDGQPVTLQDRANHAGGVSTSPRLPLPPTAAPVLDAPEPIADVRPEPEVVEVRMVPPPVDVAGKPVATRQTGIAAMAVAAPEESTPPVTRREATPKTAPVPSVTRPQAEGPHLIVSGIVFQPEPETRLAIVNDLPVMEGTLIEGAEVVEILADRVRFVREGNVFEVEMGKGQ
jgi:general secretion pathway protein B